MTAYPDRLMPDPFKPEQGSGELLLDEPWYAIQTRYRFENKIAAQLQNKGVGPVSYTHLTLPTKRIV